jgi:hypothetical protein
VEVCLELNLLLPLLLLQVLGEVYSEQRLLLPTQTQIQLEEDYLDNRKSPLNRVHQQVFHHLVEDCLVEVLALLLPLPHQQLEEGCFHSAINPLRPPLPKLLKLLRHHYSAHLLPPPLQLLQLQQHLRQLHLRVDFSVEGCLASQPRKRMSHPRLLLPYVHLFMIERD